jgi:hypothetical protein
MTRTTPQRELTEQERDARLSAGWIAANCSRKVSA